MRRHFAKQSVVDFSAFEQLCHLAADVQIMDISLHRVFEC